MAWTAEDRRKYAPAIQEVLRRGMLVRLATAIDTIDPPAKVGRPRDWSTLTMLGALWHLARDGCVWPGFAVCGQRLEITVRFQDVTKGPVKACAYRRSGLGRER